jgi:acetyltransferase
MSTYRLKNLLSPRSVALVGASPRQGSVGRAILGNIRKTEFKGEFGLVNPRYPEIDGVTAVDSLDWVLCRNWSSLLRLQNRSPA